MSTVEEKIWDTFREDPPEPLVDARFSDYDEVVVTWSGRRNTDSPATGSKPIDGVAYTEEETWIFEVKRIANPKALGQAMVYSMRFLEEEVDDNDMSSGVRPAILFAELSGESVGVIDAAEFWRIGYFQVDGVQLPEETMPRKRTKTEKDIYEALGATESDIQRAESHQEDRTLVNDFLEANIDAHPLIRSIQMGESSFREDQLRSREYLESMTNRTGELLEVMEESGIITQEADGLYTLEVDSSIAREVADKWAP